MAILKSLTINDSGFIYLPVGTQNQKPVSSTEGQLRYNSTTGDLETYNGTRWVEKNPNTPIKDGLVLWLDSTSYSGTGSTWNDKSGRGNNATLVNSPQHIRTHKGGYFLFNGTTQYANIPNGPDFVEEDSFSIEYIVKPKQRTHVRPFINRWNNGSSWRLLSGQIDGVFEFLWNIETVNESLQIRSDIEFREDQIYHIHAGYNGSNLYMYINGELQSEQSALTGNVVSNSSSSIDIGVNQAYDPDRFMEQEVYDVKIYNKALSEEDILHNYFVAENKHKISEQLGSTKWNPANSARQIQSMNINAISGTYYIATYSGATLTYCDMSTIDGGGWTLIGKSGGGSWHNPNSWLKSNINSQELQKTNDLSTNAYACIDARLVAGAHSREVMISNAAMDRWVFCRLHSKVSPETIFNHASGASSILRDATNGGSESYNSVAWNGGSTLSYVNRYSVMAVAGHGGSTPAWTLNTQGNTNINEYAMAVACANQNHNGFTASNNYNGQDAPYNSTWPNPSYNSGHFLGCVWVR